MKIRTLVLISLIISFVSFSQNEETKMAVQVSNSPYLRILFKGASDLSNITKVDLGVDFQNKNSDINLYFTYGFNRLSLYRGHYLGGSFEYHFLNNQKKIRPYFGLSILSEIASNYKEGFMESEIFIIRDGYIHYSISANKHFNSSNFYHSSPFLGTLSFGCGFRLMKGLHLNLSAGFSLKKFKYKYLEWYNDDDYREILKSTPIESKIFAYANAQLGISYAFSFKKNAIINK